MTLNNDTLIKKDRLRYTKNKLSANLTYLSIVFNTLYFVCLYSSDIKRQYVGESYYVWMVGISVLYNLVFMLAAFLCSEGVKSYNIKHGFALIIVGAAQIARIFIWPMDLHAKEVTGPTGTELVMPDGQFLRCVIYLVGSAALCVIAGVIAVIKTTTLRSYEAELKRRGSKP
ncbi:MAG: hypothetical protein K2N56_02675 [Oscillospiraceae bacterium]|nr:hypothetical protein [Oscillospiraceae bacterium]